MSKGFKICLVIFGLYVLFMSPLLLQGVRDGSIDKASLPVYLGLLGSAVAMALQARRGRKRPEDTRRS